MIGFASVPRLSARGVVASRAPRLARGGLVVIDPTTAKVQRVIAFQYNPDSINRTLQMQGVGPEPGDRLEALRLKGPPHETIKLEAEIDATDQLEQPSSPANVLVSRLGLFPRLAAIETLAYPPSARLIENDAQTRMGRLEILPAESPLTLFVWSRNRVVPVRLTELSVTEEAFDSSLNPIRAKVTIGMRVLSVNDVGFDHRAGTLFLLYQQQKERFADQSPSAALGDLGVTSLPGGG
jgi:hypothetical protein